KIAVDYAVMEGAAAQGLVATVPGDFGWTDVGDFHNLGDLLPADESGNVVLAPGDEEAEPLVRLADSHGVVAVAASGRLMSLLGLKDVVVVDTPDALLVCARDRAQDGKPPADELKTRRHRYLLQGRRAGPAPVAEAATGSPGCRMDREDDGAWVARPQSGAEPFRGQCRAQPVDVRAEAYQGVRVGRVGGGGRDLHGAATGRQGERRGREGGH